jgi:RimJ/RimL family protein N-acetyltransferase
MSSKPRTNEFEQPIGPDVAAWSPRELPPRTPMAGRLCRLEPLSAAHADALFDANALAHDSRNWTYLPYGPFTSRDAYRAWVEASSLLQDPVFQAIVDPAGRPLGVASFLRIDRANGVIEIGHLNFSPLMQRTASATEAIFLLLKRAFDELGYRRMEWKCDSLNAPSRAAAARFGFTFEGIFRQAVIVKGRNRDTAWYSITDGEWPAIRAGFERWLAPGNFDADGQQRQRLHALIEKARKAPAA